MANPRIDDLRKKLEKEPGSRLFAQLAEELRKEGQFDEAVRVARTGLDKHPNYPSARMTLGRALLDGGQLAAARREFEAVLKGAADNILASRYLGECLEGLGQTADALSRYRQTLSLAPGDKQILMRIEELERKVAKASAAGSLPAPIPLAPVGAPMALVSPHEEITVGRMTDPLAGAAADEVFEVEPDPEPPPRSGATADDPIPLVPVGDDEFELERPYDALAASAARPAPSEGLSEPSIGYEREVVFEPEESLEPEPILESPVVLEPERTVESRRPSFEPPPAEPIASPPEGNLLAPEDEADLDAVAEVLDEEFEVEPLPGRPLQMTFRALVEEAPAASAPSTAAEPELASPTLAELYFDQGFLDKAIEVYRRLLARDPGQQRLRARLGEIEAVQRLHARATAALTVHPPGSRKAAVERTIARLQDLRSALARRA